MNTNYTTAIIFTKHTNLMPWFEVEYRDQIDSCSTSLGFNQLKHKYAQDRDVQLILLVRYELGRAGRPFCKIKCPINPLPVRGEFEAVSLSHIVRFLQKDGWKIQQKLPFSLLK